MTLLPKVLRRARSVAARVRRRLSATDHQILFVFGGGHGAWAGMGRELYRRRKTFRDSIEAAAEIVADVLKWDAVAHFRGVDEVPRTLALARRNQLIHLGMIQIAQIDLWREEGVVPGGVLSLSLGEMIAPYAAGALTREQSARVLAVLAEALSRTVADDHLFLVEADPVTAQRLCRTAPVKLHYVGHRGGTAFILGPEAETPAIRAYLGDVVSRDHRNQWRYHSLRLDVDRAYMKEQLRELHSQPPSALVYSAAAGGLYAGPFDANFYSWMLREPVHFGDAAAAAIDDGFDTAINIGAEPVREEWITAPLPGRRGRMHFIQSMVPQAELWSWEKARSMARELRVRRTPAPRQPPDVFAIYEESRRGGSVQYLAQDDAWLVHGYDDVQRALTDPAHFSSATAAHADVDPALIGADPPRHTAVRRVVSRHFSGDAVARWSELAGNSAELLLQPLREGRDLDVVRELADPIAQQIGAAILGLDESAIAELDAAALGTDGIARNVFDALQGPLVERAHRAGIYDELLRDGEGTLDDAGARSLIRVLWIASTEELQRAVPLGILLLLEDAAARAQVTANPELLPRFIDEVLRLRPPEHIIERVTTVAVELGDAALPAGAKVRLVLAAANRDPSRFPDPHALRLDRTAAAHLSFGGGPHRCIGAPLARAAMAGVLRALLAVAPEFRAVQPLTTIRYARGAPMRKMERLVIGR